ncbi:MAG: threonine/serine exporter family protein [Niabella sp.]
MNELLLSSLRDFFLAAIVAVGFAMLFKTPKRVLWTAALLGGLGHVIRFILHNHIGMGIVSATLVGTVLIGATGIYFAHKVHTPPIVFTVPACITMIPGLFAYRTMLGLIKITDKDAVSKTPDVLIDVAHNFVLTSSLLFCLALGICIGALLFRQKSTKHISFKIKGRKQR